MFRLLLGGLEGLEALDELPPERLERRVPVEAREAAHLEDGVAEVPEQSQRAAGAILTQRSIAALWRVARARGGRGRLLVRLEDAGTRGGVTRRVTNAMCWS